MRLRPTPPPGGFILPTTMPKALGRALLSLYFAGMVSVADLTAAGVTHSRGTLATMYDASGRLIYCPHNLLTYSEDVSNAAWVKTGSTTPGVTVTAPNGVVCHQVRETTATSAHVIQQSFTTQTTLKYGFQGVVKDDGRGRVVIQLSDSLSVLVQAQIDLSNGSVSATIGTGTITATSLGDGFYAFFAYGQLTSSAQTAIVCRVYSHNGTSVTFAGDTGKGFYAGGLQLNRLANETTAPTYYKTTNAAYYGARVGYDWNGVYGLRNEPSRTNYIRNNSMLGTAAPGTAPTNWAFTLSGGLSRTITGFGYEDGFPYIEYRVSGTTVGANAGAFIFFETTTGIPMTQPNTATLSFMYKIIASVSFPADASHTVYVANYKADGATQVAARAAFFTADTSRTYYAVNIAYNSAQTDMAYTRPGLRQLFPTAGSVVDFTVRVYCPQFEIANNATSFILTSSAAVTRGADVFTMTVPTGVYQAQYTFSNDSVAYIAQSPSNQNIPDSLSYYTIKRIRSFPN